jgi:hypothetical protein
MIVDPLLFSPIVKPVIYQRNDGPSIKMMTYRGSPLTPSVPCLCVGTEKPSQGGAGQFYAANGQKWSKNSSNSAHPQLKQHFIPSAAEVLQKKTSKGPLTSVEHSGWDYAIPRHPLFCESGTDG